jgi:hypothetical protein
VDLIEQIQQKIAETKNSFEYIILGLGILFLLSTIFDWDWMYDPPYTHKNFIGRAFGRTAYRIFNGVLSIMMIVIAVFLLVQQM